jgi:hypothetical protein
MPSTSPHPDERCGVCCGEGEVETCTACANVVDNCECEGDSLPATEMEPCSECDGTGDAEEETRQ